MAASSTISSPTSFSPPLSFPRPLRALSPSSLVPPNPFPSLSLRLSHRPSVLVMSQPPSANINEQLSDSIKEAEEVCAAEGNREACAAAWDQVEEISATIAHKRQASKGGQENDPLEKFCKDVPEADECRVYED